MSWLDEANEIVRRKQAETCESDGGILSKRNIESLKRRLRLTYPEATEREIGKAIDGARDRFEADAGEKEVLAFLRTKLEE